MLINIVFLFLNLLINIKLLTSKTDLAFGDFAPMPNTAIQAFTYYFYAWKEIGLGIYRSAGHFELLIQSILLFVFQNPIIAQKVLIFVLPCISFFSMQYLIKKIMKDRPHPLALFIPSFFYAYAPIFLLEFVGGSIYSTLLGFAFFPLIYAKTIDLILQNNRRDIAILSLLLIVNLSYFTHLIVIYFISLMFVFLADVFSNGYTHFLKWLRFFWVGLLVFFSNFLFFLASFELISTTSSTGEMSNFAKSASSFFNDITYTYGWALLNYSFRLGVQYPFFHYTQISLITMPFFLVLLLILGYGLFFHKKNNRYIHSAFTLTILFNFLFTISFVYFTYTKLTYPLFQKIPVLFLFRNPAKMTALGTFFFSVLLFLTLDYMFFRLTKYKKSAVFLCILCTLPLIVYQWPIFTGDRGVALTRKDFFIPELYRKIADEVDVVKMREAGYRNIWLPYGHEFTSIKLAWVDPTKFENQIGVSQFSDSYYEANINSLLVDLVNNRDVARLQEFLNIFQIKNVIIIKNLRGNKDLFIDFKQDFQTNGVAQLISVFKFLPVKHNDREYVIYENRSAYPLIYLPDIVVAETHDLKNSLLTKASEGKRAIFLSKYEQAQILESVGSNYKKTAKLTFTKTSPSLYQLRFTHITTATPFVFDQRYDTGWIVQDAQGKTADLKHLIVNGFANAWIIDPTTYCRLHPCTKNMDGSYDIQTNLFFETQNLFDISKVLGVTIVLSCIGFLIYDLGIIRKYYRRLKYKNDY